MKSYTGVEQSKKLAEILPLESADMHYVLIDTDKNKYSAEFGKYIGILPHYPCWSLAALLELISEPILSSNGTIWSCATFENNHFKDDCFSDNPVDACYEMIIKLNELKML